MTFGAWAATVSLAAVITLVCAMRMASDPAVFACCYFSAAGTVMSVMDIKVMRLPDFMTLPSYPVMLVALAWASSQIGEARSLYRAAGAAAILLALFGVLHLTAGVGLGDVKLVGLIGMLLGFQGWTVVLRGLFLACMIAAGWAAAMRVQARRDAHIPMGPALVAGTLLALMA
ncbi:leader peptidase (prepilin peptidase)/N-methyltransferase [Catenulispora sp. MAP5-51]|uniref:prepilin peptidase n=1 Tax=Catenulispora sp. MAP5-51 TaxID=3156298 RepID=UPI003513AE26